jgi:hypothetical protein
VRANNDALRRRHLNRWELKAEEWLRSGEQRAYLLRPTEIGPAARWLKERGDAATATQRKFVDASKQASSHEALIKRFGVTVVVLSFFALIELAIVIALLLR